MGFMFALGSAARSKIPPNLRRKHSRAPQARGIEPGKAGGKGRASPRLHQRRGTRGKDNLNGRPDENRQGIEGSNAAISSGFLTPKNLKFASLPCPSLAGIGIRRGSNRDNQNENEAL